MNFVTFIENKFQENSLDSQTNKEYDIFRDAEQKTLATLIQWYRNVVKYALLPKVIFQFWLVKIGWSDEPQPVMVNQAKAAIEAKKVADEMINSSNVTNLKP